MEYIFETEKGRRVIIYDEGNNIYMNVISGNKNIFWGILARDYHSGLKCSKVGDDIYMVYLTIGKEIVWSMPGKDNSLILYAERESDKIIDGFNIVEFEKNIFLFYRVRNIKREFTEIRYIMPKLDRLEKILLSLEGDVEEYKIYELANKLHLYCRLVKDDFDKYFIVNKKEKNDINIEEYVYLSKDKFDGDKVKNKELEQECLKKLDEVKKDYEKELKNKLEEVENNYRNQYNELAKLTKEIQEEGKKWRTLYYEKGRKM